MTAEISRRGNRESRPFTLVLNRTASKQADWRPSQDAILNDEAFAIAHRTISGWPGYQQTPLHELPALAGAAGVASIAYKDESGRFGLGSFKALGGAYAVARLLARIVAEKLDSAVPMSDIVDQRHLDLTRTVTVCCATDGNHGRSVAWGAQNLGCRCVIFIHESVSEGRKTAIEQFGAEVRRCVGNYDDSVREAQLTAEREHWYVVSDTSYPGYMEVPKDVMQGYELMAAESFDQLDQRPTHLFLQTGVGGMAAAVAAQAKRRWGSERPGVVLVDPDESACWVESFRAGRPTPIHGELDTLMAGLACGEVSSLAWQILSDHADAAMTVPDESAVEMMRRLASPDGHDPAIVAGESAVAGLAGLLAVMADKDARSRLGLDAESRVLLYGTEGSTDPALYRRLVGIDAGDVGASGQS